MTAGRLLLITLLIFAAALSAETPMEIGVKVGEAFDQDSGTFTEGAYETLLEAHGMIEAAYQEYQGSECDEKSLTGLDILVTYNLACLEALSGQTDAAIEWLTSSVETGYADPDWMEQDTDLESLRDDDRFQILLDAAAANRSDLDADCADCEGCECADSEETD